MNAKLTENESDSIATAELRLQFPRVGDRYAFQVEVAAEPLFFGIDGSDLDAWPASPPLQQLHIQDLPTGPAALAVGAAGTTHWSASFAVRRPGVVWCEYAARVARGWEPQRDWLGSRFRIAPGWQSEFKDGRLTLSRKGQHLELGSLGETSRLETSVSGEFTVRPVQQGSGGKGTVEWKFQLSLVQPAG